MRNKINKIVKDNDPALVYSQRRCGNPVGKSIKDDSSGCSISQNSASVIFRGYVNFASEGKILPWYFFRRVLNSASEDGISTSTLFRGYPNSSSVITR